jgi:hypothetical protein
MQKNEGQSEKNIERLLKSSFKDENRLQQTLKDETLEMLLHMVKLQQNEVRSQSKLIVLLLINCFVIVLLLSIPELVVSIHILDFIKLAFGLSLLFIPVSCFILILKNWRNYANKMV